jgi:excisionase family DNA binding protein
MILKKQSRSDVTMLDPEPGSSEEQIFFERVLKADAKPALLDASGNRIDLPDPIFQLFSQVLALMQCGIGVTLLSNSGNLTTQAAADNLGVSRPHLVKLIEQGKIPCTFAGSHRRLKMRDLVVYMQNSDQTRREVIARAIKQVERVGLCDKIYIPKE